MNNVNKWVSITERLPELGYFLTIGRQLMASGGKILDWDTYPNS